MTLVQLADVRAAAQQMSRDVVRTPLLPAAWASRQLWLKAENLQPIGAFKLRGASYAIALVDQARHPGGVVAHSSGNHAQAVAYAARNVGCAATIVMPHTVNVAKLAATRALGAEVILVEPDQRESAACALAEERGAALIPPYDDAAVIAGQGTVGLEVVEDLPDVDLVLVPVSGGGLLSGVAAAVKALRQSARVVGVEPDLAGDLAEGFRQGSRVAWPVAKTARTIADGLRVPSVGQRNWEHISSLVDDVVTVSEDAIREAMRVLAFSSQLVAEPSGAVSTAAVLERAAALPAGRTVAVVSGGNVEPRLYLDVLAG